MKTQLQMLTIVAVFGLAAGSSHASILELQFSGPRSGVSFNGGPIQTVGLTVDLVANTTNLMIGNGFQGADQYTGLTAYVSSVDLGLSDVAATTPLSVEFGLPGASPPYQDSTVLLFLDSSAFTGLFDIPQIGMWNGTSSFGPFSAPSVAVGSVPLTLSNGDTLDIIGFDNAPPFGNGVFQATVVPEPGLTVLLGMMLGGGGLLVRRKKTR